MPRRGIIFCSLDMKATLKLSAQWDSYPNRQMAVKAIAERCDLLLVIGSQTSSNSKRLVEVGDKAGADNAMLISSADSIDWDKVDSAKTIGLSAGASAPEYLTDGVIAALRSRYEIEIQEVEVTKEKVIFRLPRQLLEIA